MSLRIASVSQEQYEICIENKLWGDEKGQVRKWNEGDLLLFKVQSQIMSIVKVVGEAFEDDLLIWNNGFYPNRIKIEMLKDFNGHESEMFIEFKNLMIEEYGSCYGWVILNKSIVKPHIEKKFLEL